MNDKQREEAKKLEANGFIFSLAMTDGSVNFVHSHRVIGRMSQRAMARIDANGKVLAQ